MGKTLHCPICRKEVPLASADVPFCSDRCRTIDLGKWASGDYKISSPILDPDLLEDLDHARQQQHPTHELSDEHSSLSRAWPGESRWKN